MSSVEHARPGAPPRRVLVTGSRYWTSAAVIRQALEQVWGNGDAVLVTSASQTGADRIAQMFWHRWGGRMSREHNTSGDLHKRADVCLAFIKDDDDSAHARHMAQLAQAAGIPTQIYTTVGSRSDTSAQVPIANTRDLEAGNADNTTVGHSPAEHVSTTTGNGTREDMSRDVETTGSGKQATAVVKVAFPGAEVVDSERLLSPAEVATHYSYPELTRLIAAASPGSEEQRVVLEALGLLLDNPGLFAGGDQVEEIARNLSAEQITQHRRFIKHGPLYEVLGQAARLQQAQRDERTKCEASIRRARHAVNNLPEQGLSRDERARAERVTRWQADDQVEHAALAQACEGGAR